MEPVVYLAFFFSWSTTKGATFDMETLPQASMQQCEANGAALKGVYSEMKWKCVKGVLPVASSIK